MLPWSGYNVPPLHLGQQWFIIILQSDETRTGHGGVRDGHDLICGALVSRSSTVCGVVDPSVLQPQISLMLTRIPVIPSQPHLDNQTMIMITDTGVSPCPGHS